MRYRSARGAGSEGRGTMTKQSSRVVLWALVLVAQGAWAQEWETVTETPYVVKVRPRPGTQAREVWAEGQLDASAADVQAALENVDTYRFWMPYVKEARTVKTVAEGEHVSYTRLDLPVVTARDFIIHVVRESGVAPDGTGVFAQRWWAEPDLFPGRRDTVRVRLNEGTWHVEPRGEHASYAVYRFSVDPAGSIPTFLVNMGQKSAVRDTLRAVEKRAQQLAAERQSGK
ncbi:hypothetical protein JGU66_28340 [Myxococcaceae bacterium JPH2]|nr:hypothetical protein [Myxococcaceae bacterium JPH2]